MRGEFPTALLAFIDLVLLAKFFAFFPPAWWVLRYGPDVVGRFRCRQRLGDLRLSEDRDEELRSIENNGEPHEHKCEIEGHPCHDHTFGAIRKLRYVGPPRSKEFLSSHPVVYYVSNVAWATPVLVPACSLLSVWLAKASAAPATEATVALLTAIAALTLITAPMTRIFLAGYDVHGFGLQPYLRRIRNLVHRGVNQGPAAEYDGLVIYLIGLVMLSTFTFAACYYLLFTLQGDCKSFSNFDMPHCTSADWITWLYFSSVTIATVGYGDIKPISHLAQGVVFTQIMTGPFILTWIVALALGNRSSE